VPTEADTSDEAYTDRVEELGFGRRDASTKVLVLIKDLHVQIVTANGDILRDPTLDPPRDYQPQPITRTMSRDTCERCPATSHAWAMGDSNPRPLPCEGSALAI
jgi:hypothetical protein